MLNIRKGITLQDIGDFDDRVRQLTGAGSPQYVVEPRIRGVAVEMIYEKGGLTMARTCGEVNEGIPVTPQVKTILTVPLTLIPVEQLKPVPDLISAWGFVYIEKQAFTSLNQQVTRQGLRAFAGSLEAAEDSLKQIDPRVFAKRPLNFFCHGTGSVPLLGVGTHYELMLTLQEWGLRVNRPHIRVCRAMSEVIEYSLELKLHGDDFPYELEGALIHVNDLTLRLKLGRNLDIMAWALDYHFGPTALS